MAGTRLDTYLKWLRAIATLVFIATLCVAVALLVIPGAAWAQDRDYCPTRPGLGTTPCTIERGKVSVETAIADWERDDNAQSRTDTVLIADTLIRLGVTDAIEAQFDWTPFGHVRERDKLARSVDSADRVGDVMLGLKANLRNPDGKGFAIAVAPSVTLPVGRTPVGAGDWGAALVVPVSYDLSDSLNLQLSPEIDAAVDEDGNGRHLAYGGVVGLGIALTQAVQGTIEFAATRDDDPAERSTQTFASAALAWLATDDLQFDIGAVAGLNRETPDARLYAGISRRFR